MKKRLLITSIVMMLVVAVALSTATYAWFTSNDAVTANSVSLTAATSDQSALGIAWAKSANTTFTPAFNNDYGTYVTPYTFTGYIQPAAPAALDITTAPQFYTAFIDAQGKFKSTPTVETPVYRFANNSDTAATGYSNQIHIANLAQAGSKTVYLTATITGKLVAIDATANDNTGEVADPTNYTYYGADRVALETQPAANTKVTTGYKELKADGLALIRIAVYEVNNTTYTYKGLLSSDGNGSTKDTAVGEIVSGNSALALYTNGFASTTELNLGSFAAQQDKGYAIYIWMDGEELDEAQGGKAADITLTFKTTGTATEIHAA